MPWFFTTLLVKLEKPAAASSVIAALRCHDPTLPVSPTALSVSIATGSTQARLYAWLFTGFACLALGLSAMGLYASLRFSLAQRTREIGVRIALGATPGNIRRHVFLQATKLTGSGLLGGLLLGLPATTLLRIRLHGIESSDPLTYLGLIALLAVITTLTALPLAHRASRIDPAHLLQDV
jgi:ABC-type antimicrobial peptide transport system permease subunit